eukprot:scaffold231771_cov31-Tisochrysis_lutea.AAC.1
MRARSARSTTQGSGTCGASVHQKQARYSLPRETLARESQNRCVCAYAQRHTPRIISSVRIGVLGHLSCVRSCGRDTIAAAHPRSESRSRSWAALAIVLACIQRRHDAGTG